MISYTSLIGLVLASVMFFCVPKLSKLEKPPVKKEFFKSFMSHHEEVWMILLNSCMQIIGSSQVSKGGLEHAFVDVRIIYQTALMAHATGFILVHNHPTGVLHPSKPDEELTKKIVGAGKILDIRLLDHLIISEDTYFSFADEGIIL